MVVKLEGSEAVKQHRASLAAFLQNRISIRGAMLLTNGTGRAKLSEQGDDGYRQIEDLSALSGFQAAQAAPPAPPASTVQIEELGEVDDDGPEGAEEIVSLGEHDAFRVRPDLNIWVIPGFVQDALKLDPVAIQAQLEATYPVVGAGGQIVPGEVQWVAGDNGALYYRGSPVPRTKMWLQAGNLGDVGLRKYLYTGWQRTILPATASVEQCPEVVPLQQAYDGFVGGLGHPASNHIICASYPTGQHHIGKHWDKKVSLRPD